MQSIDVQYLGGPGFTPAAISLRYPLRTAKTRKIGSAFASGLKLLFFNREKNTDPIADLSLEYVAF